MTGSNVALFRSNLRDVYVLYTPRASVMREVEYVGAMLDIESEVKRARISARIADKRFTALPLHDLILDDTLSSALQDDWEMLQRACFSRVWFFGNGISEYTRAVAGVALQKRIPMSNYAVRNSLLDRFLTNWILRFDTGR